ncbi:rhamnan synthesis F family protein [Streptococcus sp. UBA4344]|uniref:rhamnan synthesis F family protein n=1 Tax=Streptococcus sp. UBA4344 TaxID=1947564 RepID=UPI002579B84D|nr:rhamnan synthesis F family protein [Streptococcus sp. UBA4344]
MNRMLLYVHYNKFNELSPHVLYQLEQLRPLFSSICFISNSYLSKTAIEKLQENQLIDDVIQRQNEGYDFAAWKEAILSSFDYVKSFDSLTLMNDTCFGPLWDMQEIFEKFESDASVDFWGLTNHAACKIKGGSYVAEHLQSYFLSFKKQVVESEAFIDFWSNVKSYKNVQQVIDSYESELTEQLVKAGYSCSSMLDLSSKPELGNVSIFRPDLILQAGIPFVKIKSFSHVAHLAPFVLNAIEEKSEYPGDLIINHLSSILPPTTSFLLPYKNLNQSDNTLKQPSKTILHLHFSTRNGVEILTSFLKSRKNIITLVSAESDKTLEEVKEQFQREDITSYAYAHVESVNEWQKFISDSSKVFDGNCLAYIHVSDFFLNQLVDSYSLRELLEIMFSLEDTIKKIFLDDKKVGLAIPDMLLYERYKDSQLAIDKEVFERLNISEAEIKNPMIEKAWSAYWIRVDGLQKIWNNKGNLTLSDFEKILPIFNWKERYDFVLLPNKASLPALIDAKKANDMLFASELEVPSSINYPISAKLVLRFFKKATLLTLTYFLKRLNLIKLVKEKQNK